MTTLVIFFFYSVTCLLPVHGQVFLFEHKQTTITI